QDGVYIFCTPLALGYDPQECQFAIGQYCLGHGNRPPSSGLPEITDQRLSVCSRRSRVLPKPNAELLRALVAEAQPPIVTWPVPPSTVTSWPVAISRVAPFTATTAGMPNSRATVAACDSSPPVSTT